MFGKVLRDHGWREVQFMENAVCGWSLFLWSVLKTKGRDEAVTFQGMPSLFSRFGLPTSLLYSVAYVAKLFGKFRLTPFTVTMLTIDRWFDM